MCVWGPTSSIDLSEYFIFYFFSDLIFQIQSSTQIMIFNNSNKNVFREQRPTKWLFHKALTT